VKSEQLVARGILGVLTLWILWVAFCLVLGLTTLGGVACAVYWGLSIADRYEADH